MRLALRALPLVLLAAISADAQSGSRRFTTIDALHQFPGFYHLQNVQLRGEIEENGKHLVLRSDTNEIRVVLGDGVTTRKGAVEVRATLVDLGRLEPTDPRATGLAEGRDADKWPRPGEELILRATSVVDAQPSPTASVRALTLEPWKFDGQTVTIVGNFRGRNLFGDLAGSPNKSKFDFVLRGAEGAIWITNLRPKGDKFDLDINRRVDSDKWLEITGKVVHDKGLVSIDATRLKLTKAPEAAAENDEPAAPPTPLEPVQVVFSSPTEGETDVSAAAPIRIQFSRGLNEKSFAGAIRVSYFGAAAPPGSAPPSLPFDISYDAASRSIQIKMKQPLESFRTVRVELMEGAKGYDGAPVAPWKVTFTIGN
jgi:hypothetical protein